MTANPPRTIAPDWMAATATRAVMAALQAKGGEGAARFVGGCVRDTLLGTPSALAQGGAALDIDIATPLTPPQVLEALKAAGLKAVPTGLAHGTITAISGGRPYEITTLRRDLETDGRHAVVAFTDDWAQDAGRRDFRLNALYAEPDGRLHDPVGGGVADALAGRIVFVGDPLTRIREDYLRILRFFRFRAWYGRGAPDAAALAACEALAEGVDDLSAERVAKELLKLLAAPDPLRSVLDMEAAGVLAHTPLLADTARLARLRALEDALALVPDPGRALEDALALAPDAGLRLAALSRADRPELARRLRLSNALRDRLVAASGGLDLAGMTLQTARRAIYRLGAATFRDRLLLAAGPDEAVRVRGLLDHAQTWRPPRFPLGGADIKAAGVPQGPAIGRVARTVEDWWIAQDFPDDPAALAQALGRTAAGLAP